MKIGFIVFFLLFLSTFAIGINLQGADRELIDSSIDNASFIIENISFEDTLPESIPNSEGLFKIMESGVKFMGVIGFETIRTGIHFGQDNPEYFEPDFIIKIVKLIVIALIVSLLIKPVFYVLIFLVMGIIWIIDSTKRKNNQNENLER